MKSAYPEISSRLEALKYQIDFLLTLLHLMGFTYSVAPCGAIWLMKDLWKTLSWNKFYYFKKERLPMFALIPKDKYSSKESVWPENMINYITMVLTAFEVYKTENRMLNCNKTVKTDGNCVHYWKCFQVRHNRGNNILKGFKNLVEVWLTKTKEVCDI